MPSTIRRTSESEGKIMQHAHHEHHRLYVGMHDGVCALNSTDAGKTWQQGQVTPLAHAAARLSGSPTAPQRAYLAAYEAGVYRTDDGGLSWRRLASYPSDYAHSVLVHPQDAQTVYVGSEPATVLCSHDGGERWQPLPGTHDDFHCLSLSMARPQTVYVATARGPYRSDDEGQHWELINHGLQRPYTLHISAAPDDADLVLVTVSTNARRQQPQLYRSTTGGQAWQHITSVGSDDD